MTKRSKWCDVSNDTRKYVKKRDNDRCIICHKKGALTMAHVFMSRANGGKGCKENIVALCPECHYYTLDNPIGDKRNELSVKYQQYCEHYLIEKEHLRDKFKNKKELMEYLRFDKSKVIEKDTVNLANIDVKKIKKCKDCKSLVKERNRYSTIPCYYCTFMRLKRNKNDIACDKIRER